MDNTVNWNWEEMSIIKCNKNNDHITSMRMRAFPLQMYCCSKSSLLKYFCIFPLGSKLMTLLQCEQKYLNTHHVSPLSTRLGPTRSSKSQTISSLKQLRQNWLCHVLKPPSHLNVTRTDIFNSDDVWCDDICDSRGWDIVQEPVSIISESERSVAAVRMMLTGPEKHPGRESYFNNYSSPYIFLGLRFFL